MRYTPFLEKHGITLKDTVSDHAASIIDAALASVEGMINWGEYAGKKRKPCHGQPLLLAGMPLGQYHCEFCGMMLMAGMPHLSPHATEAEQIHPEYPMGHYEVEYGQPWPAGYEDPA